MLKLTTLELECWQFLEQSKGQRLYKNLPKSYDGFKKVKVRKKNMNELFIDAFNQSFSDHRNLFQRAIFANGDKSFSAECGEREPFVIFPVNGFKFIYNPVVIDAFVQYNNDVEYLLRKVSKQAAIDMFSKVIRQSYVRNNLAEGIQTGAEIVLYNVPHYYAIRKSLLDDFERIR
jgi:hypothetical protein